jgi:exopolysaccharide biosynthesis polyprenyl glycosylphosphotransferase
MTSDTVQSGVALDEPPDQRGRPAGDPVAAAPPPVRRSARVGPARLLLPGLDGVGLLLVLTPLGGDPALGPLVAAGAVLTLGAAGHYRPRLGLSVLDELPVLLAGIVAGVAAGVVLSDPPDLLGSVLRLTTAALAVAVAIRLLAYPLERRRRRRTPGRATLIVGAAELGCELGRVLVGDPRYGLLPIGYLDGPSAAYRRALPAPVLGSYRDLEEVIVSRGVRCVLVAFGTSRPADLVQILRACRRHRCEVLFVPRFYELHQATRRTEVLGGIPLVRLRPTARQRSSWPLKRASDVAVAALGLFLTAPLLAACALVLRWESGPGVLFRQERVGLDDRLFTLLKLRTLRPESDWESQTRWSVADDPRLSPIGRLLRAASLDELPQLVNVLRGDMSMVGPRPERPYFVAEFSTRYPGYAARHRVPAGLTGWAAVNGLRGNTSIGTRAVFDNAYIENWSLWLDIKILVRTIGAVLVRSGD